MKILYVSSLVSDALFNDFYRNGLTTGFVGQKYHGLFVKGLASSSSKNDVTVLSQPPINKTYLKFKDKDENLNFRYVPIINIPIVKQIVYFLFTFFYALYWCVKNIGEERIIMSSLMRIYQYPSIYIIAMLLRIKQITIACDVPWMTTIQVSAHKLSLKQRFSIYLGRTMCGLFDGYVFLTETMNDVLNLRNRPYIVVEGFCDMEMSNVSNRLENKFNKFVIIYAGGLNRKYGIKNLVEAVKKIKDDNVELWLYGNGDMKEDLKKETEPCIKFYGPMANKEVTDAEIRAMVLINPRPTTDEYTKYSFPSKTLEYMASGTYTLTTRLSGIPSEYFEYCGVIEDYSIDGICNALRKVVHTPMEVLHEEGLKAKAFVLEKKNNLIQAERVIKFAHELQK